MAEMNETLPTYEPTGAGNQILNRGGFYVSYNCSLGSGFFGGDGGSDETALVVGGSYYILNGDFREDYARLPDANACLAFFLARPELVSSWSESIESADERMRGAP